MDIHPGIVKATLRPRLLGIYYKSYATGTEVLSSEKTLGISFTFLLLDTSQLHQDTTGYFTIENVEAAPHNTAVENFNELVTRFSNDFPREFEPLATDYAVEAEILRGEGTGYGARD